MRKGFLAFLLILVILLTSCENVETVSNDSVDSDAESSVQILSPEVSELYAKKAPYNPSVVMFRVKANELKEGEGKQIAGDAFAAIGIEFSAVPEVENVFAVREICYEIATRSVLFKVEPSLVPALAEYLYHRDDKGALEIVSYSMDEEYMTEEEKRAYLFAQVEAELHVEGEILINPSTDFSTVEEALELACAIHEQFGVDPQDIRDAHENATVKETAGPFVIKTAYYEIKYSQKDDGTISSVSLLLYAEESRLAEVIWYARSLPQVEYAGMNHITFVDFENAENIA